MAQRRRRASRQSSSLGWPEEVLQFWQDWRLQHSSERTQEFLGRHLALWHQRPNSKGGARQWRVEMSALATSLARWAADECEPELPARATSADVLSFLARILLRMFKSNNMQSWKPLLILSLGVLGKTPSDILDMAMLGLKSWKTDVPVYLNIVVARFSADRRKAFHGVEEDTPSSSPAASPVRSQGPASSADPLRSQGPASKADPLRSQGPASCADLTSSAPLANSSLKRRADQAATEAKQLAVIERVNKAVTWHDMLDIAVDADDVEVRRAYRRSALLVHPDKCSLPGGVDAFRSIQAALEALT